MPELYRFFKISGKDAHGFLNGQLSCDINQVDQQLQPAVYCAADGKVLGFILICKQQEDFILATNDPQPDDFLNRLKMFILRSQVSIEPIKAYLSVSNTATDDQTQPINQLFYQLTPALSQQASSNDAEIAQLETQHLIPQLHANLRAQILAPFFNADLMSAISYSKGCFVGQEPIARLYHRSKPSKRMAAYIIDFSNAKQAEDVARQLQVGEPLPCHDAQGKPVRTQLLRLHQATHASPARISLQLLLNSKQLSIDTLHCRLVATEHRLQRLPFPYDIAETS